MIIVALICHVQFNTVPLYIPIYTSETFAPVALRAMKHRLVKDCWGKWLESVNLYPFIDKNPSDSYHHREYDFVHKCQPSVFIPRLFGMTESESSSLVRDILSKGMWQVLGANALAATVPGMLTYLRNQYHDKQVKPILPSGDFLSDFYLSVGGITPELEDTPAASWLPFIDQYLSMYDNWPMIPVLEYERVARNVGAQSLWMMAPNSDKVFVYNFLPKTTDGAQGLLGPCLYEKLPGSKGSDLAYQWYLGETYELV